MSNPTSATTAPILFNRQRVAQKLAKAWAGQPDFITQLVIDDLNERLKYIKREFPSAAIIGPDERAIPSSSHSADAKIDFEKYSTLVDQKARPALNPDELTFEHDDYDLIVSLLDLQIVNDVPGYLTQLRRFLKPDGLLLVATIGGQSLTELRTAWITADAQHSGGAYVRVAPFMDVKDAGALLQRTGYALPVTDVETHTVRYADALKFMNELHEIGASNPMQETTSTATTRSLLGAALEAYPKDPDGRISATLEIIWMSGWAPHENQQKPLKPGSAEVSLTKILGEKSK